MLGNLLRTRAPEGEQRSMQVTPWGPWGSTNTSAAGVTVNSDTALNLASVYGCVTLISETIATLPRDVYRTNLDGTKTEVPNAPLWVEQPNPFTDGIEFVSQTLVSLLLDGNAYWAYSLDGNFQPAELHVLDPAKVEVKVANGVPAYTVNGAPYRGRLLHLRGLTRPGQVKGLSPVEAARQQIGIGLAVEEFAGRFYSNGATLSGVITTPEDLTEPQAHMMKDAFARDHSGLRNAHTPGVLTNGASYQSISVTPEQAQFLATREFGAGVIAAQIFLLDPSLLGIAINRGQNLTYANLEQRGIHLVQYTLLRWIIRLERAYTFLLPKPQHMKFCVEGLMRADLMTRYNAKRVALGPNVPFMTVNEARDDEDDLPPLPGQDGLPEPPAPAAPAPAPDMPKDMTPPPEQQNMRQEPPVVNITTPTPIVNVHVDAAEPVVVPPANVVVRAAEPIVIPPAVTNVHVDAAEPIVVPPPVVNVNAQAATPEVRVNVEAAPPVIVPPAEVVVNVPEQPETVVNVAPAEVNVEAPNVTVNPSPVRIDAPKMVVPKRKLIRRILDRDEDGKVVGMHEEEIR